MIRQMIYWVLFSALIMGISYVVPGVHVDNFQAALIAAVVMGLVNMFIRPIVSLVTLPINFLTLGVFSLVINALLFMLSAAMVPGFDVNGFWSALLASVLLSLVSGLLLRNPQEQKAPPSQA
jgi:putative membrane protein